jgi:phosphatidylserine/phosphatidylglycerophosphate/cardiolipin synthase-like enzyme
VVQTGSFNYTRSAQKRNAENIIIIRDIPLALRYRENWEKRLAKSLIVKAYEQLKSKKKYP